MEVIIPIGISGSGKTRLYHKRYSDYKLISVDLIRKETTGDIDDYSKPDEEYAEVVRRIDDCIKKGESFYFENSNVDKNSRRALSKKFEGTGFDVVYVVLPADIELSEKRIAEDLKNNVERGKVHKTVLLSQLGSYNYSLMTNFIGENVQKVIYIKPGELD